MARPLFRAKFGGAPSCHQYVTVGGAAPALPHRRGPVGVAPAGRSHRHRLASGECPRRPHRACRARNAAHTRRCCQSVVILAVATARNVDGGDGCGGGWITAAGRRRGGRRLVCPLTRLHCVWLRWRPKLPQAHPEGTPPVNHLHTCHAGRRCGCGSDKWPAAPYGTARLLGSWWGTLYGARQPAPLYAWPSDPLVRLPDVRTSPADGAEREGSLGRHCGCRLLWPVCDSSRRSSASTRTARSASRAPAPGHPRTVSYSSHSYTLHTSRCAHAPEISVHTHAPPHAPSHTCP